MLTALPGPQGEPALPQRGPSCGLRVSAWASASHRGQSQEAACPPSPAGPPGTQRLTSLCSLAAVATLAFRQRWARAPALGALFLWTTPARPGGWMGLRTESSKCQEHGLEAQENVLEKRELRDHRMDLAGQRCVVSVTCPASPDLPWRRRDLCAAGQAQLKEHSPLPWGWPGGEEGSRAPPAWPRLGDSVTAGSGRGRLPGPSGLLR